MQDDRKYTDTPRQDGSMLRGVMGIVAVGVALGLAYNLVGLMSSPAFGITWIGHNRAEDVVDLTDLQAAGSEEDDAGAEDVVYHDVTDPLAFLGGSESTSTIDLPDIPVLDRPIQMQLPVVKDFFDAGGALFVDSREAHDYALGHVPGAINLPFEHAATDPARLESIDTGGKPIIAYCGGGDCETSINLCWLLLESGHTRVTYFRGGFPEWAESGYPVDVAEAEVDR